MIDNKSTKNDLQVASFYSFSTLSDEYIVDLISKLKATGNRYGVLGTILLASEGVNGTICGPVIGIKNIFNILDDKKLDFSSNLKLSCSDIPIFKRLRIRRKKEIVTLGVEGIKPSESVGEYVDPVDWNELIEDQNTLLIDTRNFYEVAIGSFKGSVNPKTNSFRDFPLWVDRQLKQIVKIKKPDKIAMYCTGGIRCEKATSYLKRRGFKEVYHLRGGILRYLEEIPSSNSQWDGECYVFDKRVALNHKLRPGTYTMCFACGRPISYDEKNSSYYQPGVQCIHCVNLFTDKDRDRFRVRHRQMEDISNLSTVITN